MTARKEAGPNRIPDFGVMEKGVEAAMHSLPLRPPREAYEATIPGRAEKYVSLRHDHIFYRKPLPEKEIQEQVQKIGKQCEALLISIMMLDTSAANDLYRAMEQDEHFSGGVCLIPPAMRDSHPVPTIGEIMASLQRLMNATSLKEAPTVAKKSMGRDRELLPREVARAAIRDFCDLTGERPTLSKNQNGFPYFLEAIFEALDIRASAADRARETVEWWNSRTIDEDILLFREQLRTAGK